MVGIVQSFIFHKVGCCICSLLLFPRFKPCQYSIYNIQAVKTHTVGNYSARPVLKDVQLELYTEFDSV